MRSAEFGEEHVAADRDDAEAHQSGQRLFEEDPTEEGGDSYPGRRPRGLRHKEVSLSPIRASDPCAIALAFRVVITP